MAQSEIPKALEALTLYIGALESFIAELNSTYLPPDPSQGEQDELAEAKRREKADALQVEIREKVLPVLTGKWPVCGPWDRICRAEILSVNSDKRIDPPDSRHFRRVHRGVQIPSADSSKAAIVSGLAVTHIMYVLPETHNCKQRLAFLVGFSAPLINAGKGVIYSIWHKGMLKQEGFCRKLRTAKVNDETRFLSTHVRFASTSHENSAAFPDCKAKEVI